VKILDRKVVRDIWSFRGQVATIALLIAAGVAVLLGSASNYFSLLAARDGFYREARFADIFASMTRAPLGLVDRIRLIPGVAIADARIVKDVRVDWPASSLAVSGRILSLPTGGEGLNRLQLAEGRWIDPSRRDEVLVHAAFAEAWRVRPGDKLTAILDGNRVTFTIVGIVHSPEFVYATRPGLPFPDDRTFVAIWADPDALAAAFDLRGAFNDVAVRLAPGALTAPVIAAIDDVLGPYGGATAYDRSEQASNRFLEDELVEQETMAITVPLVFFCIAAFLLNIVLGRLVESQREQIAALKALGFPSLPVSLHYLKFTTAVWSLGAVVGVLLGVWYANIVLSMYQPFFRFPSLPYVMPLWLPAIALAASYAVAEGGVALAIRRVLVLKPAVAMRPAAPGTFSRTFASGRVGPVRLSPRSMIVVRGMLGRPLRTGLTIIGIALALPMVVMGLFWWDALDTMERIQFDAIERGDAVVSFAGPKPREALLEIGKVPGVLAVEGYRSVGVRLSSGSRSQRLGLMGVPAGAELFVSRDADLRKIFPAADGLTISRRLAEKLGVEIGGSVVVDVIEGKRPSGSLPVVALVDDILGLSATIEAEALNRFLGEADLITEVRLRIDPRRADSVWRRLAELPGVTATTTKSTWRTLFDEKIRGLIVIAAVVLTGFGLIIAIGVVYNSARITFHERAWELASLQILGFRRGEASAILFAELVIEMLIAVPVGLASAQYLINWILQSRANESFRLPPAVSTQTFALATLTVAAAAMVSALFVRRLISRLDLVSALKTRD
jgi:putative ABC transport system permease protein